MTSDPKSAEVLRQVPAGKADDRTPRAAGLAGACLDSACLLRGHSSVEIVHRGVMYRLQETRLGKLILTK